MYDAIKISMATQTPPSRLPRTSDRVLENCYSLSRKVPIYKSSALHHTISGWLAVISQCMTSKNESWQQHLWLVGRTMNYNTVYETHVATADTVETVSPHEELADAVHHCERHFATQTRGIEPHCNWKGHMESTHPSGEMLNISVGDIWQHVELERF